MGARSGSHKGSSVGNRGGSTEGFGQLIQQWRLDESKGAQRIASRIDPDRSTRLDWPLPAWSGGYVGAIAYRVLSS